ncbi:MAG: sterol desaturase family protein, partial [Actinomycetota bacterium]|nr:sterol desaturase family protein [Actinomycetota bacterium]
MALCLAASLLGGSTVDVPASVETVPSMGLDWFVVNVLLLAFLFVPLERLRPLRHQSAFRPGWTTDLVHFFVSHLLVQLSTFLTLFPARTLFGWIGSPGLQ